MQRTVMTEPRRRFGPAVAAVALLSMMALGSLLSSCANNRQEREAQLVAQIDSLQALIATTGITREEWDQRARPVLVNEFQIRELEKKGLADPLVDVAEDLRSHPELLPNDAVPAVGGKFGFYDPEGIHLLTTKWVLAAFDDGHRGGHMLLEFAVQDTGIVWKPLAWALE
ncbi:MAG: hypothetical protein R6X35_03530 [Candidatus Krumholzibacteriia bacterium]